MPPRREKICYTATVKKIKLRKKIFILYTVLLCCSAALVFALLYRYTVRILTNKYTDSVADIVRRTTRQTETLLLDLDRTALFCVTNPVITGFLSHTLSYDQLNAAEQNLLNKTLITIVLPASRPLLRTSLYNDKGKYLSFGIPDDVDTVKGNFASDFFAKNITGKIFLDKSNISLPHPDFWGKNRNRLFISISRIIMDVYGFKESGIVEIQLPFEEIIKILDSPTTADVEKFIFNDNFLTVYSEHKNDEDFYKKIIGHISSSDEQNGMFRTKSGRSSYIVFFAKAPSVGWTTVFIDDASALKKLIRHISITFLVLTIMLIVIFAYITFFTAKKLTQPLELAIQKIGDTTTALSEPAAFTDLKAADDESSFISSTFNRLFEKLQDSISEKNTAKTEELKAHFIALQSQIDPHFLYNMLAVISACSREQNNALVIKICSELSAMFRYITVFNKPTVALQDEIRHTENYLSLMKIRFGEQVDIRIDTEEGMESEKIKVPRLILQPLVENCFAHAFKRTEPPWKVYIRLYRTGDFWHCTVEDNGRGIEEKKLFEIFYTISEFLIDPAQHIEEVRIGGMGLINTGVRLKMFVGMQAVFEIHKSVLGGTEVHIGGTVHDPRICC
mgnify:FL=1